MAKKGIRPCVIKKRIQNTKNNLKQSLKNRILKHRDAQIEIRQIQKCLDMASSVGGMDVQNLNWKPNTRFRFLIICVISFIPVGFHTIIKVWGNLEEVCLALATYNFFFHGSCIIYTVVHAKALIQSLYARAIKIISEHKPLTEEGQCVLKYRGILHKIVIVTLVLHLLAFINISFYVIFGSILYHELTLPFGIYIPFINEKSIFGYTINLVYQIVQMVLVISGFSAIQIATELLIIVAICLSEIVIIKFKQLDRIIVNGTDAIRSFMKQERKILECIKYHQKLLQFLQDCELVYSDLNAVAFLCYDFQIIMLLFVVIKEIYLPGYAMIFLATLVLLAICLVGTFVQQKVNFIESLWSFFLSFHL